jgi:hypothetical protein
MSTVSNNSESADNNPVDRSKLFKAALASIAAAVIASIIAYYIVRAFVELPANFPPLSIGAISFFTIIGTGLGALTFWWLSRRSATPVRTYWIIAVIALILSILPNLAAAINPALFPFPGGSATGFLVLVLFHVIAMLVSVTVLTRLATEEPADITNT